MIIVVWFGILKWSRKMMGIVLHRCDSITSRVTYGLRGVGAKQALQPFGNHCDRSTSWCAVVGQHSLKWKLWTFRNVQRCAKIFGVRWFILTFPQNLRVIHSHSSILLYQIWLVWSVSSFNEQQKTRKFLPPFSLRLGTGKEVTPTEETWGRMDRNPWF